MSPRPADPGVRMALIEAAARLVATGGLGALTIRRLAAEVGTSTMAIYTHFGGMEELRAEMQKEGFARLASRMAEVPRTRDPVADVTAMGWAYCVNALANPHLYRIMFMEAPLDDPGAHAAGASAFEPMVEVVQRCIDAGRFAHADAWSVATQLWTMGHGFVTLRLAGLLTDEVLLEQISAMAIALYVGFGDERSRAERSLGRALRRMERSMPVPEDASAPAASVHSR